MITGSNHMFGLRPGFTEDGFLTFGDETVSPLDAPESILAGSHYSCGEYPGRVDMCWSQPKTIVRGYAA